MSTIDRVRTVGALAALVVLAVPLSAQEAEEPGMGGMESSPDGVRGELLRDFETLEEKYTGLVEVLEGRFDWRPAEGVRSVGEVLTHVAGAHFMYPMMYGVEVPEEYRGSSRRETMARIGALSDLDDPDAVVRTLERSFRHAREALSTIPDARLEETVSYYAGEGTVRELMIVMATHSHEHLGQLIAYARTNGIAPPWSR